MDSITVSSSLLIPTARNAEITPAMLNVIWFLADRLDGMRLDKIPESGVLLRIPSKHLRNPDGRSDNIYLRDTLDRLLGVQLHGEHSKGEWGAVLVAQWEFTEGGSMTELLIPPAAIHALKAPKTFAKIEVMAAYQLNGHARRLYAALADKKNMRQSWWEFSMEELRALFDTRDKYPKWAKFNIHVLQPALAQIEDFGTVTVKMTPTKLGRSITGVRFDWAWKDPHEATETDRQNALPAVQRRKEQIDNSAPPLTDPQNQFKKEGTAEERAAIADRIMKEAGLRRST